MSKFNLRGRLAAGASLLLQQDLSHHPFVLVIQEMTMKNRHTLDDRVGEVQDDINRAAVRNIQIAPSQ